MPTEAKRKHQKVPFTLFRTRKAFWIEYLCGITILVLLIISYTSNISLTWKAQLFLLALAMIILGYTEVHRVMLRYRVLQDKLIIIEGLLKQDKKNIYFHALGFVPDINIKQSVIQRVLGYGAIAVVGGMISSFEIKDVSNPHKIMEMIEDLIEESKHPERKKL